MPTNTIFMGEIPLGKLFFMRLENAFLLAPNHCVIEVVSDFDCLESELDAWCRLKGEKFLLKTPLKHCFLWEVLPNHTLIQNVS